jgi:serine/threonine-protein kinase
VSKGRPGVPPELDRIVGKALLKDPERRYQDAGHLMADLQQVSARTFVTRKRSSRAALLVFAGMVSGLVTIAHSPSAPAAGDPNAAVVQQLCVKGRFFLNKRTVPALESSIKYFQEATVLGPGYAPAYAGLAAAYLALRGNPGAPRPPSEYLTPARRAALEARRLEPENVEVRVVLATIKQQREWDWAGAEREFKQVLALEPSYPAAHHRYGVHLAFMRRFDEAIAALKRAEQLDPVSLAIVTDLGMVYNWARQPDDAIPQLQKALEMDRTFTRARYNLAEAYRQKGLFGQALAVVEEIHPGEREYPGRIVITYFRQLAGRPTNPQALLDEVLSQREYIPAYFIAHLYAMLGDSDRAFQYLEKALAENGPMARLYVDPHWETYSLFSDPRYTALLRRIGLPPQ